MTLPNSDAVRNDHELYRPSLTELTAMALPQQDECCRRAIAIVTFWCAGELPDGRPCGCFCVTLQDANQDGEYLPKWDCPTCGSNDYQIKSTVCAECQEDL